MALDSSIGIARNCGWLFVSAALVAMACGGEDNSGDDDDDDATVTTTGTPNSTTGGSSNPGNCPATNPGNARSCDGLQPGLACSYGGSTCTCSGISWNCVDGSGSDGNSGPSNGGQFDSSGTNASTNTSGNGFGGGDDGSNDTVGSATTGFNTDCEGVTPAQGEACETSGTVCGLEESSDEVCVCFALGSDGPTWTCASGDIGGFGGAGGD